MSNMISPEQSLLRLTCRLDYSPEIKKNIKLLIAKGINWDGFIKNALEQGVLALLYSTLTQKSDCAEYFPASFFTEAKNAYCLTLARNTLFLKSLEDSATVFNREGIEVIIFKGLMLAESVYHDLGARPMSDLDILVKVNDIKKVDSLLRKEGFWAPLILEQKETIQVNSQRNSLLYSKNAGVSIFFHVYWHIINVLPYDPAITQSIRMDALWERAIPFAIGNAHLRTFSYEHQLLYLCMHAMNHSFRPLIRRVDISEFVRGQYQAVEWNLLVEEAFRFRLSKYLYYGLYLIAETLGADIPADVLGRLKPSRISFLEREFIASVLQEAPATTEQALVNIGMNESLRGKTKYLIRLLFPSPKELSFLRQKEVISFFEYFRRFWEGMKYGGRFLINKYVRSQGF